MPKKHYHCPVNGWDCPYFRHSENHHCVCTLENPMEECDDFASVWEGCEPDEYTDEHDLICSKCGGIIDEADVTTEHTQEKIIRYCYGHCMNCNTPFGWTETFTLQSISDFNKMEP